MGILSEKQEDLKEACCEYKQVNQSLKLFKRTTPLVPEKMQNPKKNNCKQ
jgi:hypothetical protein